jgi:hypothetical protein
MILYKPGMANGRKDRPDKTIQLTIDEYPQRPVYVFKNDKAKVKFIKQVEALIRKSSEYKEYIQFLKTHMDMNHCTILKGLKNNYGKKYSIEIHHEPFTLFDIVQTVLNKHQSMGIDINPFSIADEVMELHYDEKVGLVPLSKTVHELIHKDKVFLPLQYIYHKYDKFYDEYELDIDDRVKEKITAKVLLSQRCPDIMSDVLKPEFVYFNIEGINFPTIPEEWKDVLSINNEGTINE